MAAFAGTVFDRIKSDISKFKAISSDSGQGKLSGEHAFSVCTVETL